MKKECLKIALFWLILTDNLWWRHECVGLIFQGMPFSWSAAFSPLANSPPAISPAANGPPAKSPPPAAIRPPPIATWNAKAAATL